MKEPTARAARRRALGLGALASLWVFIGRSAARAADALTINPNGEVSVDKLSVTQSLAVAGPATISGKNTLEFGAGVTGKQTDAGKIGYQTFSDALDIVGAGPRPTDSTKPGPRKIKFWAEGGATLDGSLTVSGNVATASVTGKGALPVGAILMWSGDPAKPPVGWVLCDGGNKTPDLRGRFIVGYHPAQLNYDRISNVGGEERHKLEVNEIPHHKHPLGDRIEYIANHTHRWAGSETTGVVQGMEALFAGKQSRTLTPLFAPRSWGRRTRIDRPTTSSPTSGTPDEFECRHRRNESKPPAGCRQ